MKMEQDIKLRFFQLAVNHIADGPIWYDFFVTARFEGKDKSMGFRKGRIYHLPLEYDPRRKWWGAQAKEGHWCPYASPEAFLTNWSPIEATVTIKKRL